MDEKLKRAGDQFNWNNPRVSRRLRGILDISYEENEDYQLALRTGILSLDLALGGGLASGIVEIHGDESVGKTALVGSLIYFAQKCGYSTALCATEYLDLPYLEKLGVNLLDLAVIKGRIEAVEPIAIDFVGSTGRLLVIDSLTALRPAEESPENWNEGIFRLLSCLGPACNPGSLVVVTNQSRVRRSIHPGRVLTSGTETAARRFTDLFSVRLELGRNQVSLDAYTMVVNVEANVLASPAVMVELPVTKGIGIDVGLDTLRVGIEVGLIEKGGPHYYIEGRKIGRGETEAADAVMGTNIWAQVRQVVLP